jgi:hypothetical protein
VGEAVDGVGRVRLKLGQHAEEETGQRRDTRGVDVLEDEEVGVGSLLHPAEVHLLSRRAQPTNGCLSGRDVDSSFGSGAPEAHMNLDLGSAM